MGIFIAWIILSFVVAAMGSDRKIGGFGAFLVSLFFSPIIGILVVLASTKNSTIEFQKKMLEALSKNNDSNRNSDFKPISNEEVFESKYKEGSIPEKKYQNVLQREESPTTKKGNSNPSKDKRMLLLLLVLAILITFGIVSQKSFKNDQSKKVNNIADNSVKYNNLIKSGIDFSPEIKSLNLLKTEKPKQIFQNRESIQTRENDYAVWRNQIGILKGSEIDSLVKMARMYEKLLIDIQRKELPILKRASGGR